MLNGAWQTGYLVLHHGVLACYASEPTVLSQGAPQYKDWISCCGLEIEDDTGENDNG